MAQGFYTLDEAARRLGISTTDLNQMAQRREVRAFADRGTWRFRQQDIEELARRRGLGSDAEHQLGDSAAPRKGGDAAPFELSGDQGPDFGTEIFDAASRKPAPGSDSDVRLVPQAPPTGGSSARLKGGSKPGSDSDVKLVPQDKPKPPATPSPKSRQGSPRDRDSKLILESDSDIRLEGAGKGKSGDSDVRLDVAGEKSGGSRAKLEDSPARLAGMPPGKGKGKGKGGPDDMTDVEINLDQELAQGGGPRKPKKRSEAAPAPFELSQDDLDVPGGLQIDPTGSGTDITDVVNLSSPGDSSEISLDVADSGVGKGSGINLATPSDSGISLEPGAADEIEIRKPGKGKSKTPRPKSARDVAAESSSDFELSIDDSGAPIGVAGDDSGLKSGAADSSEFELNLDEGGLAPLGDDKGGIFETNLDLKAGDDESSPEVVPLPEDLDAELEGRSEFELAIGEEDEPATVDETGSEVIPIDDEVSDAEATLARPEALDQLEDEQGLDELIGGGEEPSEDAFDYGEGQVEEELDEEAEAAAQLALARAPYERPAEWGVLPMIFLIPTTAVMFLAGFLLFEMLQGVWSYDQPTFISGKIAEMFGKFLK